MRRIWTSAEFDAPSERLWRLLVELDMWPRWGPSVHRAVAHDGELAQGSRGEVTTMLGLTLPFRITTFEPGTRWAWEVGGLLATDHLVEALGPRRCRVGFGVPWAAAPYLVVCRVALCRLGRLVDDGTTGT